MMNVVDKIGQICVQTTFRISVDGTGQMNCLAVEFSNAFDFSLFEHVLKHSW